jgi:hypothetical protein
MDQARSATQKDVLRKVADGTAADPAETIRFSRDFADSASRWDYNPNDSVGFGSGVYGTRVWPMIAVTAAATAMHRRASTRPLN